jgi:hypothetical protein
MQATTTKTTVIEVSWTWKLLRVAFKYLLLLGEKSPFVGVVIIGFITRANEFVIGGEVYPLRSFASDFAVDSIFAAVEKGWCWCWCRRIGWFDLIDTVVYGVPH